MNCITNQVFFFAFTAFVQCFYNSLHICKGKRLLAIYYVKFLKVFSLRSPGYFFHIYFTDFRRLSYFSTEILCLGNGYVDFPGTSVSLAFLMPSAVASITTNSFSLEFIRTSMCWQQLLSLFCLSG